MELQPPSYSQDPATDETRLESTPRAGPRLSPTGTFSKICSSATLVLLAQESDARAPSYGREACIRGLLLLDRDTSRSNITDISVKLQGRIEAVVQLGATITKVLNQNHCLWSSSATPSSSCPETIEFACHLPATFEHEGVDHPLPPSYVARFPGYPTLFAQCVYSLTISITKSRRLLSKTKTIFVPLNYNPQTSPPQGICPITSFFAALKAAPEEWFQSSFIMQPRGTSQYPIYCEAFSPSVKIFSFSDSIPLHIQLAGELASLQQLVGTESPGQASGSAPALRVYLMRRVSVSHHNRTTQRTQRIGEGRFWAVPPDVDVRSESEELCFHALDWDGEVRCGPGVTVAGFHALGLTVKDFITIELVPPHLGSGKSSSSSLLVAPVQHTIPIRLVTEAFVPPT